MKNLNSDKSRVQGNRIAKLARALRESEQIVEAKRGQSQSITKMQIQTMENIIAWEEQIKLPIPNNVSPSALLSELKSHCRSLSRQARDGSLKRWR
jgi:DNA-binding protein H-NS